MPKSARCARVAPPILVQDDTHMYHACTCRSSAGRLIGVIGAVFSDEINRVLNVIAENRFFAVTIALIARDLDRFRRLIVDGAIPYSHHSLWGRATL